MEQTIIQITVGKDVLKDLNDLQALVKDINGSTLSYNQLLTAIIRKKKRYIKSLKLRFKIASFITNFKKKKTNKKEKK